METESQEKELLALQEKLLNGEDSEIQQTQSLSEPPIAIVVGILVIMLYFKRGDNSIWVVLDRK